MIRPQSVAVVMPADTQVDGPAGVYEPVTLVLTFDDQAELDLIRTILNGGAS